MDHPVADFGGLTTTEAQKRLVQLGPNEIRRQARTAAAALLLTQFKSPIVLILIGAAAVSLFLQANTDAILILSIVLASGLLGFWQEYSATDAVAKLQQMVATKVRVLRDGTEVQIPLAEVVPGDVALLSAGAIVPGDASLIEARELYLNEAVLTGETFPVDKTPNLQSAATADLFMGTHVVSGSGKVLILSTGKATRFGKIAETLRVRRPETEFEHGIRRSGTCWPK
jgi:P-type Mg2+ transporter